MTNTKFRKRALLSSVAMLLVALVALGSATFAWFTSSTQATANGISVRTIKSSELVISKSDLDWKTTVDYNYSSNSFTPVSTNNGTAWFEAEAENKLAYNKAAGDEFSPVNSATNHYYSEMINVGNKGDAAVENVKIDVTGLTSDYARLAIYEVTANVVGDGVGTHATSGETFAQCIYDSEGDTYAAVTGATTTSNVTATSASGLSIDVGTLAGKVAPATIGGVKYYKFFIWFEGQDVDCFDSNAGAPFGNLEFTVSGDTAS